MNRFAGECEMLHRFSTRWLAPSLFALLVLGLVGCGNANMSGHVVMDKKPVVFGTLLVIGPDHLPRQVPIKEDGSYRLADIPPGEVKVAVNSVDPKSTGKELIRRGGVDAKLYDSFDHIKGWFPIPAKFGDFNTSGLTYTLQRGDNPIEIELK
jgi:hypothetical protein